MTAQLCVLCVLGITLIKTHSLSSRDQQVSDLLCSVSFANSFILSVML